MTFGKGSQSDKSLASKERVAAAKRKTDSESFEEECKRQAVDICRLQYELDEALAQRDLAIQQRDEALAKTIPMVCFSKFLFCLIVESVDSL
jgi:hypothetical protein